VKNTKTRALFLVGILLSFAVWNGATQASGCSPSAANRPVCPAGALPEEASFIDPSAAITGAANVHLGAHNYIGPFALINGTAGVTLGDKSNVQDNVVLNASKPITIHDEVILAHGARVNGPATLGGSAGASPFNASFVGFNSVIDGATLQPDAMVLHLARIAPGIIVRSGKVVLSGKFVTTQAQADDATLGKVIPITDALRTFMEGVLHVNETFARTYTQLYYDNAANVTGINYDPSDGGAVPGFNPTRDLPVLAGVPTQDPAYRNRIIGKVIMDDTLATLYDTRTVGYGISLRADEGEPFHLGVIESMGDGVTFHALEHTGINARQHVRYGKHSLVHGGVSAATQNNPESATLIGFDTNIGDYAAVFRSTIGARSTIGCASLVDGSVLPNATKIPSMTVVLNYGFSNYMTYPLEWNPGCRK